MFKESLIAGPKGILKDLRDQIETLKMKTKKEKNVSLLSCLKCRMVASFSY